MHDVPADHHEPQAVRAGPAGREQVEHVVPVGGGEVGGGEAEPGQPTHQFGGRPGAAAGPAAAQDDRRAREQGAEDLLQGGVGAQHGQLQDAFAGREPVRVDDPVEGEHQRTVGDRDPLGPAGRPGGVDQVREIVRARAVVGPKPTRARAASGGAAVAPAPSGRTTATPGNS